MTVNAAAGSPECPALQAPPTVVLITGAAPYLGGAMTWVPLREAAPEIDFIEIDTLDFAFARDLDEAAETILPAIRNANAIVAHYSAASLMVNIAAHERLSIPILLLSPMLVMRQTVALRIIRTLFGYPPGSWLLTTYARSKQRRLNTDRRYVERQLRFFVGGESLTEGLIEEAQARLRNPQADRLVERTAEFFRYSTAPIAVAANEIVRDCAVLVGGGLLDRGIAKQMSVTLIPGVSGAAMLEAPDEVARELRRLIRGRRHNPVTPLSPSPIVAPSETRN